MGSPVLPAPAIQQGASAGSVQDATATAQQSAQQQQAFLNALQSQQGGTQSQQQALAGLQGLGNNGAGAANLQSTYGQLQGVANGTGPNPAAAQLAQATGANTANQAALMAGQRGAGANVGLEGRQAAMQGAANQQNAAGQAATLQSQQSLNALGQMGGIAGQQAGNQLTALQGAGGLANQQVGQQQTAMSALQQANQNQQNAQLGALANQNSTAANIYGTQQGGQNALNNMAGSAIGGLLGGVGAVGSALAAPAKALAHGGEVSLERQNGPKSYLGKSRMPGFSHDHMASPKMATGGKLPDQGESGGKKVPAMVSDKERYISPHEMKSVVDGRKSPMHAGKEIHGAKAEVSGDSLKNDKIPATLEEGGLVLPRSVTMSKDPEAAAHEFIKTHYAKKKTVK